MVSVPPNRVGGGLEKSPDLSHHRAYCSVHGGSINLRNFSLSDTLRYMTRCTLVVSSPTCVCDQDNTRLPLSLFLFCRIAFAVSFQYPLLAVHTLLCVCILAQTLCGTYNSTLCVLNYHCPSWTHLLFFVWLANPHHCNRSFLLLEAKAAKPHRHSRWLFVPPALPSEPALKIQDKIAVSLYLQGLQRFLPTLFVL